MAHTVLLTRGIKHEVDHFIEGLCHKHLPFNWYNPETKKMEKQFLQIRVSPIQLWDISYPIEWRDPLHNTLFSGYDGTSIHKRHDKYTVPLRIAMKLDKIPEYKKDDVLVMAKPKHIEMIGIGVKDDLWITEDGKMVPETKKTPLSYEGI